MAFVAVLLTQGLVVQGPLRTRIGRSHAASIMELVRSNAASMELIDLRRTGRGKKVQPTQFGIDPRGDAAGNKASGHWEFPAPGAIGLLSSTEMLEDALQCSDHVRQLPCRFRWRPML
eukprot:3211328-Prymnesium_polylepis.2